MCSLLRGIAYLLFLTVFPPVSVFAGSYKSGSSHTFSALCFRFIGDAMVVKDGEDGMNVWEILSVPLKMGKLSVSHERLFEPIVAVGHSFILISKNTYLIPRRIKSS